MPAAPGTKPLKELKPGMGLYQVFYWPNKAPSASKPWAVANLRTGDVNGRWHATKEEALAQARALYARLGDKAKVHSEEKHNVYFCFADAAEIVDDGVVWLQAIAAKTYNAPGYGSVPISEDKILNFVSNFHENVRGQEIATNYDHGVDRAKGNKASGWIRDARYEDNHLWVAVDFTETARQELKNNEWKYFSLEWEDEWEDNDGKIYNDVIVGGALTNRPVAKYLMPINFSELFVERADLDKNMGESKEMEHSEPGSGTPPQPRTDGDGHDEPDRKEGWRINTPPIALDEGHTFSELEGRGYLTAAMDRLSKDNESELIERIENLLANGPATFSMNEMTSLINEVRSRFRNGADSNSPKGGYEVGELTEKDLRELRNVLDVDDDAKIVETVKVKFGELSALRDAVAASEQEKHFAEQYPQYWEEHNKLMERDRTNSAKVFSESVSRIRKAEGYGLKDTRMGLSVAALEKVVDTHKKFAEGTATIEDFEACLKSIVQGGIVEFGEIGSSSEEALPDVDTNTAVGLAGARKLFAEVVSRVQKENPELDYLGAVAEASKKHPDLAQSYSLTLPA
jgi:hypothetical protein